MNYPPVAEADTPTYHDGSGPYNWNHDTSQIVGINISARLLTSGRGV